MPPSLADLLTEMRKVSASRFVFPDAYLNYRELPNPVRKQWSQRYRQCLQEGLRREDARQAAWHAVTGCQRLDRPIAPDRLTDLIPRLVKKAGLPHCTLHDLRRTFCSYLASGGTDQLAAQKLAGHSSPVVTAKYYVGLVAETFQAQRQLPHWTVPLAQQGTCAEPT